MTWWTNLTGVIWRLLDEHGLLVAFVLLFVEEAGVPPIIPGDFLMLLVGVRAAQGDIGLLKGLAALELATVLGGSVLYWVSAWGGHDLVYRLGRYVGATPERLGAAAAALERHGERAIVLGRLVPGLCILTAVVSGVLGFPYRRFLPALALGGFLHLLAFVLLGYFFGPPILAMAERLHLSFELLASLILLFGLGFWVFRTGRATPHVLLAQRGPGERLRDGLLAGLLGAIEAALLVHVLIHMFGLFAFETPGEALVASGLLRGSGPLLLVLIGPAFLIAPTLWGAVYGVWAANLLPGPGWLRGALFSTMTLAVSLLVVLPLVGAGPFGLAIGAGPIPAMGEALRHLAYGLTLGTAYPALARREPEEAVRAPHPA
jgi:membrane-associated protein